MNFFDILSDDLIYGGFRFFRVFFWGFGFFGFCFSLSLMIVKLFLTCLQIAMDVGRLIIILVN
jgi:hypothetical protein